MNTTELKYLTANVIELSNEIIAFLLHEVGQVNAKDIQTKGIHDFVTYVDQTAEQKIATRLGKLLPGAGMLLEEKSVDKQGDRYRWVVDPLDGTTNFIHRLPVFSVSIALIDGDKPLLGVVHEANLNECFSAWQDAPALLNGSEISVSSISSMDKALLATGFPYYDYRQLDAYMEIFKYFMQHTSGLRRLGSAAVDLAYVACGRFEGFYEYGLHPWDVAAGAFIVQQAGGKVTGFHGDNNFIFGGEMLASNKILHNPLQEVFKRFIS
jgi:Archaeal fructose-1,6-bisphosphatase and related enzymes of inositol monophosphatase family